MYYHSQITAELLLSGTDYSELPDIYVIFICNYDPFGEKKYMYSFENICKENKRLPFQDGTYTICLSTHGENREEVPKELVKFLEYAGSDLDASMGDFEDEFVARLQESVRHIKASREMEECYMLFEEVLKTERKEGKMEGRIQERIEAIIELLEEVGDLPEILKVRLESETNLDTLKTWHRMAAKTESIDQFMREIQIEQ